jgi:FtsP/CotA-like multicopper oxidase with cupredoxin domain
MKIRKSPHLIFVSVIGLMVSAMVPQFAVAQIATSAASATPQMVQPVPNACPRFAPGSVIHQPQALFSQNGVLSVQFSYQTTTDFAGRTLYCFMTPSGMENPTLHVKPGEHLIITVTNNTPDKGFMMKLDAPNCGPGGSDMRFSSLNIHYHGTNTSPTCHADEVIKTIINTGQTFQYHVVFPSNEPPGLYWYHPHVHGVADQAVLGGASGALVVDGIENVQPAVSGLRHRILVIRDQNTIQNATVPESPGGTPDGVPFQDVTINNISTNTTTDTTKNPYVTTYTPAILHMEPGEQQFWRVTNSASDTILDLQLQFDGKPQTLRVVAIDGVPVNSQDGAEPGSLIPVTHFRLPPAARVEFIANAPPKSVKLAQLVTLNILTGQNGDDDPNRPLFNIQLVPDTDSDEPASDDRVGQFTALNSNQRRFAGLATAPVAVKRLVFFDEIQPTQFFMAVDGQPELVFNPNAAPAITATQGTVEEWTIENRALENHEFHFHQLHFLVKSQNNFEINNDYDALAPAIVGQYLDMVEVPNWDGNTAHPFPNVKLRIDFRGPDIGTFVFHCHILNHEDLGMMNIIQVVPASNATDAKKTSPKKDVASAKAPAAAKPAAGNPLPASMGMEKMKMQ